MPLRLRPYLLLFLTLLSAATDAAEVSVGTCSAIWAKMLVPHKELPMIHIKVDQELIDEWLKGSMNAVEPNYLTGMKRRLAIFLRKPGVLKGIYNTLNGKTTHMGDINAEDLLKLMTPNERYNIVVVPGEIRLIRALKDAMGDRVSKHIIAAEMSPDVRFAGEAWTDGKGNLFVNNNSGTYQPSHASAQATAQLLRQLLKHDDVEAEKIDYGALYAPKPAAGGETQSATSPEARTAANIDNTGAPKLITNTDALSIEQDLGALNIPRPKVLDFNIATTVRIQSAGARVNDRIPRFVAPPENAPARLENKQILFTKDNCNNLSEDGQYTVLHSALNLRANKHDLETIPPIRVYRDQFGRIWSLDNRRLAAFRLAGNINEVPVIWASEEEVKRYRNRFTNYDEGRSTLLDIGDGKSLKIE